ncbi:PF06532 family protein [Bacteriovorax sp. BAL6_X]|uniref:NrsF family protein n=1 Tax=Bacteriovorax sp. BAL6_X TaxID=1201290 RepID=UPI0003866BF9|nr:NrsF family protein [Bacteriovorax sp. BAL6_X]EPZ49736.1 PF06532 family protein [Bacteriovorax sp. BAL6_X]
MVNEKLINSLVSDLRPIKRLASPGIRAMLWAVPQFLLSVIAISISSPIEFKYLLNTQFVIQVIFAIIALGVGSYLGFTNTIPGLLSEKKAKLAFIPFIILLGLIIFNIIYPVGVDLAHEHRTNCYQELSALMIIGFVHNYYMLKKGLIAFNSATIATGLLTSGMIPLVILYFGCSFSTQHLVVSHYIPIIVITTLGLLIFKLTKNIR